MNWTDVWHGPFKYDHYGYVWDRDNVMVFTVEDLTEENDKDMQNLCNNIVSVLNKESINHKYDNLEIKDGCDLYMNNEIVGSFRGWGHLTGGLKLSIDEAIKLQDGLINYVMSGLCNIY